MRRRDEYLPRRRKRRRPALTRVRRGRPGRPKRRGRPKGSYRPPGRPPIRYKPSLYDQFLELPTEIKNTVISIIFWALGLLIYLSLIGLAGRFSQFMTEYLSLIFGAGKWLLPFVLLVLGYFLMRPKLYRITGLIYVGATFLILSFNGLIHLIKYHTQLWLAAKQGLGGGLIGLILSWPLLKIFGFWTGLVMVLAIFLVSLFLFFQISFDQIGRVTASFKTLLKKINNFFIKQRVKKMTTEEKPELEQPQLFKSRELDVDMELEESSLDKEETAAPEAKETKSEAEQLTLAIKKPAKKIDLPLTLLNGQAGEPTSGDIKASQYVIQKTLKNFGIEVEMGEVNVGPTVTQYTVKPAEGIKLSRIVSLSDNLALALAAHPIRIEAPIPGKSLVGIEVPNRKTTIVPLREVLNVKEFRNRHSNLIMAIGKDVKGRPHLADLDKMPHLLICGATNSGKTAAADTYVFSDQGMLTFKEICPLPLNSEKRFKTKVATKEGIETTSKNYNNGICNFYKITNQEGYQIEVTAEHPLWTIDKQGKMKWQPAAKIKTGDYVAISRNNKLFGNKTDLSDFRPSKNKRSRAREIKIPKKMTPELGCFLGLLTADGGLTAKDRIVYTQDNEYWRKNYQNLLKKLFKLKPRIELKKATSAKHLVITSKRLKDFLKYLGMSDSKSIAKEVPLAIRQAPAKVIKAYLAAVLDNDGYLGKNSLEYCVASEKLARQIQLLLLNFGIITSLKIKKIKTHPKNKYYQLSIYGNDLRKFIKEIGVFGKRDKERAARRLNLNVNTNHDMIPCTPILKSLAKEYREKLATYSPNRQWQYQKGIKVPKYSFPILKSYNSGDRLPSYRVVKKILNFYKPIANSPNYKRLRELYDKKFFWAKVKKITKSRGEGYDFEVPGSNSFVGNGFINHNSVCINSIILSLLFQNGPDELKFIMVDPKRVELPVYNGIPHLLTPVITDVKKTINALKWAITEMDNRFSILQEAYSRNIHSYNATHSEKMPYIIIVIDELADLMAAAGPEIEGCIIRLAQMARAVGIHLVVATQRPSVDVLTGLIKANITSRIAFSVASLVDSRTILDMSGAEKLLGRGDMLFSTPEISKPKRLQGAFASDKEIKRVIKYLKDQAEPEYIEEVVEKQVPRQEGPIDLGITEEESDPLLPDAKEIILQAGKASASLLQRRLRIGYARAARILDLLEEQGFIGPADGAKPREILSRGEVEASEEEEPDL